jgi:hypothetical protein
MRAAMGRDRSNLLSFGIIFILTFEFEPGFHGMKGPADAWVH